MWLTSVKIKFCRRTAGYTLFDHKRNEEILEELKVKTSWWETKKLQIELFMTCNENKEQQDARNDAEL